jgi:hypothetical protein
MQYAGALIVNHEVLHASSPGMAARVSYLSDYVARLARHLERGGLDETITDDDRRLEMQKQLVHYQAELEQLQAHTGHAVSPERLHDMMDYRDRQGRFANIHLELPIRVGEVSGGCWDLYGVRDPDQVEREILQSGSNLITSVITVKRADAERLGLTTKQDWQQLMRSTWDSHVEKLGVISRADIRWVSYFHVDNAVNLHVHTMTWDASGRFSDDTLIPKSRLMPARQKLVQAVFAPELKELYLAKDYLRALTIAQTKLTLGQHLTAAESERLEQLQGRVSITEYRALGIVPVHTPVGYQEQAALRTALYDDTTKGYKQYGSLSKESRAQVDRYRQSLVEKTEKLHGIDNAYKDLIRRLGEVNGYKGASAKSYAQYHRDDLNQRLGNVITKSVVTQYNGDRFRKTQAAQPHIHKKIAGTKRKNLSSIHIDRRFDKISWAMTPEQKEVITKKYDRLRKAPANSTLLKEITTDIVRLAPVQVKIKNAALTTAREQNLIYKDALRLASEDAQRVVSGTIQKSLEEKIKPFVGVGGSLAQALATMSYLLPQSSLSRARLDTLQQRGNQGQRRSSKKRSKSLDQKQQIQQKIT